MSKSDPTRKTVNYLLTISQRTEAQRTATENKQENQRTRRK